jgi:uncharacterized protein
MSIDKAELELLTREYGGEWGINHTKRLLHLINIIGEDFAFNSDALWIAAHLHDWGAYPAWVQKDVDHGLRSRQVADHYLMERNYPEELKSLVLDCILHHHSPSSDFPMEVILLRDADALDFLGVVGVMRNFSLAPRDMRKAFEETKRRRDRSMSILFLEKAKALASERVAKLDELLIKFEEESAGLF